MKYIIAILFIVYHSFTYGDLNSAQSLFIGPAYIDDEIIYSKQYYPDSFTFKTVIEDYKSILKSATISLKSYSNQHIISNKVLTIDPTKPTTDVFFSTKNLPNGSYIITVTAENIVGEISVTDYFIEIETSDLQYSIYQYSSTQLTDNDYLSFEYDFSTAVDELTIYITNDNGDSLWSFSINELQKGYQTLQLPKTDLFGQLLAIGQYKAFCFIKKDNAIHRKKFTVII